jgi:hypothetical protein
MVFIVGLLERSELQPTTLRTLTGSQSENPERVVGSKSFLQLPYYKVAGAYCHAIGRSASADNTPPTSLMAVRSGNEPYISVGHGPLTVPHNFEIPYYKVAPTGGGKPRIGGKVCLPAEALAQAGVT